MKIPRALRNPSVRSLAIRAQDKRRKAEHYDEIYSLAGERGWKRPTRGVNPSDIFTRKTTD